MPRRIYNDDELRGKALELRKRGYSHRQIAKELGFSVYKAHELVSPSESPQSRLKQTAELAEKLEELSARSNELAKKIEQLDLHYYTLGKNMLKRCKEVILWSNVVHTLMPLSCSKEIRKLKPLVSHFHHPVGIERPRDLLHVPMHHLIEKSTYTNSDLVIAQSWYGARKVSELFGLDQSKVRICYCGVDIERFSYRKKQANGDDVNLLFVGVLERRKGVEYALYALRHILKKYDKVKLTVVGNGPEEKRLKKLANELGILNHVEFKGFISGEQLSSNYNNADIFIFPSLVEGFGMALAEATACGLPVITSNISAIPEVVGDAGILVEPRSSEAIANAILKLIKDEDLRVELGKKARKRIKENFTWGKVTERIAGVYRCTLS